MNSIKIVGKCKIIDNEYVIKDKGSKDLEYLFNYLKSKNFYYIPDISLKDGQYYYSYVLDNSITDEDKYLELIRVVSLLHQSTSYQKSVSKEKYDTLYNSISDYIDYYLTYFYDYLLLIEPKEDNNIFELFFMNNYSYIINYFRDIKFYLDKWYDLIKDHNSERVCIIHNNLSLNHFIMGKDKVLVSWDSYMIDSPLIDVNKLIKNEYLKIDVEKVVKEYISNMDLSSEELLLLKIVILLPFSIEFNKGDNLDKFKKLSFYISYLKKCSLVKGI